MKTKALFIAALVMVSSVISAVGKDAPSKAGLAVVPVKGSEIFKVIYKGETTGRVKMALYNSSNTLVFAQTISNVDGFILPLNFKGLAFGEYTLDVIDSNGKRTEKIEYTSSKSVIRVAKLIEEGKFLLAIVNPSSTSLSVRIFNSADQLIHAETKEIKGDYAQVYKVTNTTGVTFEVSDNAGNVQVIRY